MSVKTYLNGKLVDDLSPADRKRFDDQGKARLADMLASNRAPSVHTDATFFANINANPEADAPGVAEEYRRVAIAHGQNPVGKTYLSALAAFPGDPEAWVSGRGDIRRVCEARGWSCEGAVTVSSEQVEPAKPPALAADIVDDFAAKIRQEQPSMPLEAARELAVEVHAPAGAAA